MKENIGMRKGLRWIPRHPETRKGVVSDKMIQGVENKLQLACMKPESLVITGQPYGGEFVLGPRPRPLQLACMKPESLVIAGQPYGGEFVPGPRPRP
ncbi:hypothetical protein F2Q68_00043759 [Brassica cretica]|uniref:Uncharacterized protein n=1 Tax=Brassica cretica TaxID=69181 RepID=A0A8S9LES7_BRACR|nr:hypothetical protein F2Q68_00043759 [Brassica cretica]